jgi:choline kinase
MQHIILAAGLNKTSIKSIPKCLEKIKERRILDEILNVSKQNNISNIALVGGFEITQIMSNYPDLKYFYNSEWKRTNSLFSLTKSFQTIEENTLVSYADTLHTESSLKLIDKSKINVFFDSNWVNRYENRNNLSCECVKNQNKRNIGEFSGLFFFPISQMSLIIQTANKILLNNKKSTLVDLINSIASDQINYIDLHGNWTEFDSIQDVEHFKFGTKAETLNKLQDNLKRSKILAQYVFTVDDFNRNPDDIIRNVQSQLKCHFLIIRSSALNEDTENASMAGNYESILRVDVNSSNQIKQAITKVIQSYIKNGENQDVNNQILIQPYLENVTMSGVVFSKDLQTSSPYYTINYDVSSDTESVTSGNGTDLHTLICFNKSESPIDNSLLNRLIDAIKEIELFTKFDSIDVEFAYDSEVLYILQVRPIAAKKNQLQVLTRDVSSEVRAIKRFIKQDCKILLGEKNAYGVMPDWNPAEIIGINPKELSFNLYRYLITDTIWAKSRHILGYRNVSNSSGLVSLAGKPYVDIKMSFNTFIPKGLNNDLAGRLVDYFIGKLEKNPENHDKVEFESAITSYDFNFEQKEADLLSFGFTTKECFEISKAYRELTINAVKKISIADELEKLTILETKRKETLSSDINKIDKIYTLLSDCKKYGTLPFANLARLGFIGSILLKSLLSKGVINNNEYDDFYHSIHTVAKSFIKDLAELSNSDLSKESFLKKYGHLRPGTYEISSSTYNNSFDKYIDLSLTQSTYESPHLFTFSKETEIRIASELHKHKLDFTVNEMLSFIIQATEARELSKFEFTKNLSATLELIADFGGKYGLNRDDLSHLNLWTLLQYKNSSTRVDIKESLTENILRNRNKYKISSAIKLPELIFSKKDIDFFFYPKAKPNYITSHSLVEEIVQLKSGVTQASDIENKIIFIENADPGFDWIFSHNIKGLVTKYGGSASHMAIRCAEFDLPAAIGCGDQLFSDLLSFKKISLDCINQKIHGII